MCTVAHALPKAVSDSATRASAMRGYKSSTGLGAVGSALLLAAMLACMTRSSYAKVRRLRDDRLRSAHASPPLSVSRTLAQFGCIATAYMHHAATSHAMLNAK